MKRWALFLYAVATCIVVLDQASKHWVLANFEEYQRVQLLPVLDFVLAYNYGAAWSFLNNEGGWQRWPFVAISAVVSVVLVVWIYRLPSHQRLLAWALTFILGGAVGNLYDRVVLGKVVDFILFYYDGWHFPAFNVADAAITLGAALLILDALLPERQADGSVGADAEQGRK
ncbi:lipoprotein signal peptidase [bacterium]|nr:lipoprotein signal peptidase [bacterium]